ncbi:MAG TPA: magnesium/cobalt transporter CorA [Longimicrobiales bacterium]|nr:magnesium/cobalt transporter CorA [Longimicrobiales bacterium]
MAASERGDRKPDSPRGVARGARRLGHGLRKAGKPFAAFSTFRRRSEVGAAPGTLMSHPQAPAPVIRVMGWDGDRFDDRKVEDVADLGALRDAFATLWVNIDGVGRADVVEQVGDLFGLHRLALEDVMNVHQRAKVEEYPTHLYVVARMAHVNGERLDTEQVSLFLGEGFVVTFQEREGDSFDPVRERLRGGRGRIRTGGADYLAYALIDAIIDGYYPVLEDYGDWIESLETQVIQQPRQEIVNVIHDARRDVLALRHAIWPLREAIATLYREPIDRIAEDTRLYLRDAYDHTVQIIDLLENYRELTSALLDVYLSSLSNRMNEVMKVLTIIATIFIPLTFIAGVYGMNFSTEASPWNMPELHWYWGYPAALGVMLVVAIGLVFYFRHKHWL